MADGSAPSAPRVGRPATTGEINTIIRLFSASLDYTIDIPGTHYSGLTNAELFEILAGQGRDFAKNTPTLRKYVAAELRIALEGATRLPTNEALDALVAPMVLAWVMKRLHGKVRDVAITRLTRAYAEEKFKAGYHTPIGVRTGALYYAVASATVVMQ